MRKIKHKAKIKSDKERLVNTVFTFLLKLKHCNLMVMDFKGNVYAIFIQFIICLPIKKKSWNPAVLTRREKKTLQISTKHGSHSIFALHFQQNYCFTILLFTLINVISPFLLYLPTVPINQCAWFGFPPIIPTDCFSDKHNWNRMQKMMIMIIMYS